MSRFLICCLALALVFSLSPVSAKDVPAPSVNYIFHPSGMNGGGFVNVVAIDPFGSGLVISGGDLSGVHRSTDLGTEWVASSNGFDGINANKIASIVFSKTTPGKVYAAAGHIGASGGFYISENGGTDWTLMSDVPQFAGGNTRTDSLPAPHPRSTGTLIAADEVNDFLYVATFKDGVMRSKDGGSTWETIGLQKAYLRGLAFNPDDPNRLYVTAYGEGVWMFEDIRAVQPKASYISAGSLYIEELAFVGDRLYAVGSDGETGTDEEVGRIYRISNNGAVWEELLSTPGITKYLSIDGYVNGDEDVLYVGAWKSPKVGKLYETIIRSDDSGETWYSLTTDAEHIHYSMAGSDGERWWMADGKDARNMIGGPTYVAAQIAIDPSNPQTVLLAGRSGLWRTMNGGGDWYPIVSGLGGTINYDVKADPADPNRVYVANADWDFVYSSDAMDHVVLYETPSDESGIQLEMDVSTSPSGVYIAQQGGEIFYNPDPIGDAEWQAQGLMEATGMKQPLAFAIGADADGRKSIIAAVEKGGLWKMYGAEWRQMISEEQAFGAQTWSEASISWPFGSNLVYAYDHATGVWRSSNYGETWEMLWAHPSPAETTGFVIADSNYPDTLYVSAYDGLYRLGQAGVGTVDEGTIVPVDMGVPAPGALAMDSMGTVYVASRGALTRDDDTGDHGFAGLYRSVNQGQTWKNIADDYYMRVGKYPRSMSVGADGKIYVALHGNSVVVGTTPKHDNAGRKR